MTTDTHSQPNIIRAKHSASQHYFIQLRATAQDNTLSFEARGVISYLLSKPPDWTINETELQKAGGIGRQKMRGIIDELITRGYMTKSKQTRHEDTQQFQPAILTLHEAVYEKPSTGEPYTGEPSTAFHTHTKYREQNKDLQNKDVQSIEQTIDSPDGDQLKEPPSLTATAVQEAPDVPAWTRTHPIGAPRYYVRKKRGYPTRYFPVTVKAHSTKRIRISYENGEETSVKPGSLRVSKPSANTSPLQAIILEYSWGYDDAVVPDDDAREQSKELERAALRQFPKLTPERLRQIYEQVGQYIPKQHGPFMKMVRRYAVLSKMGQRNQSHFDVQAGVEEDRRMMEGLRQTELAQGAAL